MTKIKNTKKGMAKKTLSISLAVAMLATSNVPVWAAEFTDGTDAAFTSEAPVEVETPVVEETLVEAAEATEAKVSFTLEENGWGYYPVIKDAKYSGIGDNDGAIKYEWKLNGNIVKEGTLSKLSDLKTANADWLYIPKKEDLGGSLQLALYRDASDAYPDKVDPMKFSFESNVVVVSKRDINKVVDDTNRTNIAITTKSVTYDGKEHKTAEEWVEGVTFGESNQELVFSDEVEGKKDFTITVTSPEGLVNAGTPVTISVKPVDTNYYTGEFVVTTTNNAGSTGLTIAKRTWVSQKEDLKVEVNNKTKEYDGSGLVPAKKDLVVTDVRSGAVLDSEKAITSVWLNNEGQAVSNAINVGKYEVVAKVDSNETNYNNIGSNGDLVAGEWEITKRDLAHTNITFNAIEAKKTQITDTDVKNAFNPDKVTDLEGNSIIGLTTADFDVKNIQENTGAAGYYTAKLVAKGTSDKLTGEKEVTFRVYNMSLNGTFDGKHADGSEYATHAEEYTGEAIVKDPAKLGNFTLVGQNNPLTPNVDYSTDYVYSNNKDAGTATLTVKGKNSYYGSEKTFNFTINPAEVTNKDVTAKERIEKQGDYATKAEAYDTGIVVKAHNGAKPAKEFTLVKGTDYDVSYSYETSSSATDKKGTNVVGNYVRTHVKLTNKNFIKAGTAIEFDVYTEICDKLMDDVTVTTVNPSYVYTGEAIVPELIVKDGNYELEKDVDYRIRSIAYGTDVGTATVIIEGKGEYSNKSTATTTFVITPADVNDLVVNVEDQVYTGHKIKPARSEMTIKLGKVAISDRFTITYPGAKGANTEVGKGTFTLTPDGTNKNFTGSKEVTFNIVGKIVDGIDKANVANYFKVYDADGKEVAVENQNPLYNGKAHTFAKAEFNYIYTDNITGKSVKLEEGKDFEIKYFHNVYGDDDRKAYIAVVGKGNYAGNGNFKFEDENGQEVNAIAAREFAIKPVVLDVQNVTVKNGEYSEGLPVKPNVTVTYGRDSLTLVEGEDYELDYPTKTEPTDKAKYTVKVKGIHGYVNSTELTNKEFAWGIDKKDLANCDIEAYSDDEGLHVVVMNGEVRVAKAKYIVTENADRTVTVTPAKDSKHYTGSKTVKIAGEDPDAIPETPVIVDVKVSGNNATAVLSGACDGATGYDYVISKDRNCIINKDYAKVNRNKLTTDTTFTYTQQGTYYAYCHAWKRGADGKKIFSEWSNPFRFEVSALTPSKPVIKSVKVNGSTVTVTYDKAADADGYDVVLGSKLAIVSGEKRPVEYGTLVKKNQKTTTVTFKNVKKGTYYVGLHAFNRTSEDGKKVFSPWSSAKKVTVK